MSEFNQASEFLGSDEGQLVSGLALDLMGDVPVVGTVGGTVSAYLLNVSGAMPPELDEERVNELIDDKILSHDRMTLVSDLKIDITGAQDVMSDLTTSGFIPDGETTDEAVRTAAIGKIGAVESDLRQKSGRYLVDINEEKGKADAYLTLPYFVQWASAHLATLRAESILATTEGLRRIHRGRYDETRGEYIDYARRVIGPVVDWRRDQIKVKRSEEKRRHGVSGKFPSDREGQEYTFYKVSVTDPFEGYDNKSEESATRPGLWDYESRMDNALAAYKADLLKVVDGWHTPRDILDVGECLTPGLFLRSPNDRHTLTVNRDGTVTLLSDRTLRWGRKFEEKEIFLKVEVNGTFVVYSGRPSAPKIELYRTRTANFAGQPFLQVGSDGNLTIRAREESRIDFIWEYMNDWGYDYDPRSKWGLKIKKVTFTCTRADDEGPANDPDMSLFELQATDQSHRNPNHMTKVLKWTGEKTMGKGDLHQENPNHQFWIAQRPEHAEITFHAKIEEKDHWFNSNEKGEVKKTFNVGDILRFHYLKSDFPLEVDDIAFDVTCPDASFRITFEFSVGGTMP